MNRISRLSIALVLAMLAAACGGGSSDPTTTTAGAVETSSPGTSATEATSTTAATSTTEATSTTSGGPTSAPPTTVAATTTTTTTVAPTTEDPAARVTVIAVKWANGELVGGQEEYEVARDAVVEITVTADVSDEVHVHGYDVFADVAPGEPGSVTFTASIPGIFEVEFEGSGLVLFELVVS